MFGTAAIAEILKYANYKPYMLLGLTNLLFPSDYNPIHTAYCLGHLYNSSKQTTAKFLVEFWGLKAIIPYHSTILDKFMSYNWFLREITRLSLKYDDTKLFSDIINRIEPENKEFRKKIKRWIRSLNAICIAEKFKYLDETLQERIRWISDKHSIVDILTECSVLNYFNFKNLRGFLKYWLKRHSKFNDIKIHTYLGSINFWEFIYEFSINSEEHYDTLLHMIYNGIASKQMNMIKTLFSIKWVLNDIYCQFKIKTSLNKFCNYFIKFKDTLTLEDINFLFEIMDPTFLPYLESNISASSKLNKKERKELNHDRNKVARKNIVLSPRLL